MGNEVSTVIRWTCGFRVVPFCVILTLMTTSVLTWNEAFQKARWDTPGWALAKEVVVTLNSHNELDSPQKIQLIVTTLKAVVQSQVWLEFLVAVSDHIDRL